MNLKNFSSKKFVVAVLLWFGSTGLCSFGRMTGLHTMVIYLCIGIGYGLYNVLDKKTGSVTVDMQEV